MFRRRFCLQKLGSPLKSVGESSAAAVAVPGGILGNTLSGGERGKEAQRESHSRVRRVAQKTVGGMSVGWLDLLCDSQCSADTTWMVISLAGRYEEM